MVLNRCAEEGLFAKGGLGRRVFLAQWGACRIAVSGAVCLLPYVLYGAWDEELIGARKYLHVWVLGKCSGSTGTYP